MLLRLALLACRRLPTPTVVSWAQQLSIAMGLICTSMIILQTLQQLGKFVRIQRPLLLNVRRAALLAAADAAQRAADKNEHRELYAIVKSLASRESAPLKGSSTTMGPR